MGKRKPQTDFMTLVQTHERAWGTEQYPNRPTLAAMLEGPVVAFWRSTGREKRDSVSVHKDLARIDLYLVNLLLHTDDIPDRRLYRVFMSQQEVEIVGVQVKYRFGEFDDES